MARFFTAASSDRLTSSSPGVTTRPCSMAAWVYPTNINSTEQICFALGNDAAPARGFAVGISTGNFWEFIVTGDARYVSSTTATANTWHHLLYTVDSSGNNSLYLDGNTTPIVTRGLDSPPEPYGLVTVGCQANANTPTFFRFFDGRVAKVGLWNIALGTSDLTALQTQNPSAVQPGSLQDYWKLCGLASPEPDAGLQNHPLTVTGTSLAANPPAVPNDCGSPSSSSSSPSGGFFISFGVAAASSRSLSSSPSSRSPQLASPQPSPQPSSPQPSPSPTPATPGRIVTGILRFPRYTRAMTQQAAQVTTGLAPLVVGSTLTVQRQVWLNGLPWDLTGGSVRMVLADPNGNQFPVTATSGNGFVQANWTVANPPGTWTLCFDCTDSGGVRQVSAPEAFLVETSPV